jgi:ribosomal protein S18 acetylase RimI-like enzyme
MIADTPNDNVTYFKRYRMELDLVAALPPVPNLPVGFAWRPWTEWLLETHADVKCQCFQQELDSVVFPNLSNREGCLRLMKEITNRPGFCAKATWLIADGDICVGTIQGVGDRIGTGGIQNLGVIPAYRGKGLGAALLLQALHGFRHSGLAKASLEVTAQNETAIQMYRRYGFRFRKTLYRMVDTPIYRLEPISVSEWVV